MYQLWIQDDKYAGSKTLTSLYHELIGLSSWKETDRLRACVEEKSISGI